MDAGASLREWRFALVFGLPRAALLRCYHPARRYIHGMLGLGPAGGNVLCAARTREHESCQCLRRLSQAWLM